MARLLQANMTRGELTPYVHARVDTEHYSAGLKRARNMIMLRYGGFCRAPGTLYGGAAKSGSGTAYTRFLPFWFSDSQTYFIEAGNLYFRFWIKTSGVPARIESGGSPVEVATPYATADLWKIQLRQSGDVIYIVCDGYQPRKLTRNSETSWTLTTHATEDGPWLPINITSTTLTPTSHGALVDFNMSSDSDTGYTAASSGVYNNDGNNPYKAFDRVRNTYVNLAAPHSCWVSIDLPTTTTAIADKYALRCTGRWPQLMPIAWTIEGWNGTAWVTIDRRSGETGWSPGEIRYYDMFNKTAFQSYRLSVSGVENQEATTCAIAEWTLNRAAASQTAWTLTASSTTGINGGNGFQVNDVGRLIRLQGGDGLWRWCEIISRSSTTSITVKMNGQALPDLSPILIWRLGAFSTQSGWPKTIALHEDRLFYGSPDSNPLGGYGSKSSDYDDFGTSSPLVDDDAIAFTLTGGRLNAIRWLQESRDLAAGTSGTLRAVGRNDDAKAFGPANIRQRNETYVTTADIPPVTIENMLVFLDKTKTRLYEAAYTYEVDGYIARELTALNEHLLRESPIKEVAYQGVPHRILWLLREDGKLVAATYDRDQKVFGCSLVDTGGTVESICCLPGTYQDDLMLINYRNMTGLIGRFVECLADYYTVDGVSDLGVPVYGMFASVYDGAPTTTITGLPHGTGTVLGVWVDGFDAGDVTVNAGAITIPNGLSGSQVVLGLRQTMQAQTLRVEQYGQRDGTGLGRKVNIVSAHIDIMEAAGLRVGPVGSQDKVTFEDEINDGPYDPPPLRDGMFPIPVDGDWDNGAQLVITNDRMYPSTVRALSLEVDGEP